jgi:hypothetical protein
MDIKGVEQAIRKHRPFCLAATLDVHERIYGANGWVTLICVAIKSLNYRAVKHLIRMDVDINAPCFAIKNEPVHTPLTMLICRFCGRVPKPSTPTAWRIMMFLLDHGARERWFKDGIRQRCYSNMDKKFAVILRTHKLQQQRKPHAAAAVVWVFGQNNVWRDMAEKIAQFVLYQEKTQWSLIKI